MRDTPGPKVANLRLKKKSTYHGEEGRTVRQEKTGQRSAEHSQQEKSRWPSRGRVASPAGRVGPVAVTSTARVAAECLGASAPSFLLSPAVAWDRQGPPSASPLRPGPTAVPLYRSLPLSWETLGLSGTGSLGQPHRLPDKPRFAWPFRGHTC